MAVSVVDELELIEVDHEQQHSRAVSCGVGQRLAEAIQEQSPVWQSRQRIVSGEVASLGYISPQAPYRPCKPSVGPTKPGEVDGCASIGYGSAIHCIWHRVFWCRGAEIGSTP